MTTTAKWWRVRWMVCRDPSWAIGVRLFQNLTGDPTPPRSLLVHVGPLLIGRIIYAPATFASKVATSPKRYGTNASYPLAGG